MKKFSKAAIASMRDAAATVRYSQREYQKSERPRFKVHHKDCAKVGSSDLYGTKRYNSLEEKYQALKKAHEEFVKTHSEPVATTEVKLRIGDTIEITVLGITKRKKITSQEALDSYSKCNYRIV